MEQGERAILSDDILETVGGTSLFYPCSGCDLFWPIELFSGYVDNFWFADTGYFLEKQYNAGAIFDVPADEQLPLLQDNPSYRFIEKKIQGPVAWDLLNDKDIEPCVLSERYEHCPTSREITIHRRRGYGFSAFRKEDISPLGVFFYRGDSYEGGSGNLWFEQSHLSEICEKLIDGGLIVTDGSLAWAVWSKSTQRNWNFQFPVSMTPEEIIKNVEPFSDKAGRRFTCVGYAGKRCSDNVNWPTLVLQVSEDSHIPKKERPLQ